MALDATTVHKGTGKLLFEGREVGEITSLNFILQKLGLPDDEGPDGLHSGYGTLNGKLSDLGLVDQLNTPHPPMLSINAVLEGDTQQAAVFENVELIDDIPRDGSLENVEFRGKLRD